MGAQTKLADEGGQARALLSVVVVSYRVRRLLRDCLESLRHQSGIDLEILVVDNASGDGSVEMVAGEFPEVRLVANTRNAGFARANNQALALARGVWLLLLNPDTVVPPGALRTIVDVFGRNPRAGCVGPALTNPDGSPQPCRHAFPTLANLTMEAFGLHRLAIRIGFGGPIEAPAPAGGEGPVDWVSGACMAISRESYRRVGGLDETSFMYGEEMDWSWRARARGFDTVHSDRAHVMHHGGAAGEGIEAPLFVRNIEARLAFMRRYHGSVQAAMAREVMTFGSGLRWLFWRIRGAFERSPRPRTVRQIERFGAVLAWRRSGPR
jgi:hypothetical protein